MEMADEKVKIRDLSLYPVAQNIIAQMKSRDTWKEAILGIEYVPPISLSYIHSYEESKESVHVYEKKEVTYKKFFKKHQKLENDRELFTIIRAYDRDKKQPFLVIFFKDGSLQDIVKKCVENFAKQEGIETILTQE
jgi:hypothetical protein